jgi:hypothetical protein
VYAYSGSLERSTQRRPSVPVSAAAATAVATGARLRLLYQKKRMTKRSAGPVRPAQV